jgi:hypothetical protein
MRNNFSKRSAAVLFCALAMTLLAAPGSAQDRPVVGAAGITYNPAIDYERVVLTLSGMGRVWQQSVDERGPVIFDLAGPDGELLRDGDYTWEMRIVPRNDGGAERGDAAGAGFGSRRGIPGLVHSGYFMIVGGQLALAQDEEPGGRGPGTEGNPQTRDQVILDDLIVNGSACVGQDCVNGESFGFDTLRLKENNLRIKFLDTSTSASFPTNDWQLTANDSSNGGANKFSIDDIDGGRTPFTIEASAPSHSLYVDDAGRIGLGTSTPVVEVHVVDGDSPTVRLEQDGSSGFTPQTWDVAGNETNFFIRDASNGSKLPFRIRPGAPSQSLYINTNGDLGVGTQNPDTPVHIERTDGRAQIHVEDSAAGNQQMLHLEKTGDNIPFMRFTGQFGAWDFIGGNNFVVSDPSTGINELVLTRAGDLTIQGQCSEQATGTCADYVFEPGYEYLSLEDLQAFITENKHLPNVPSTDEIRRNGLSVQNFQGRLLEKVEELVLYTLEQQDEIDELKQANAELLELKERLALLEEAAGIN